jgi:membrane fusion protein (multidrug efflux system)
MKLKCWSTFLFLAASLLACDSSPSKSPKNDKNGGEKNKSTGVQAYIVQPASFAETLEVPGNILANESVEIHPEMSGRIVALNLQEGKTIEKGTVLAKLYDGDLVAQLRKLEVQLQLAQKTEERQAQLLRVQGISQQDYDISLLQVNNLKADIGIIKTSLEKTEIKAPFNGQISLKNISVGAYVTPANVITKINQNNILKVDFAIPEKYSARIKLGQLVALVTAGNIAEINAKIIAIDPNVEEKSRSLLVRAQLINLTKAVLPGSFAKIKISFDPDPNALLVPAQAILPQARGKKIIVYRNGIAQFQDVTTGVRSAEKIQIIEGLNSGDTIVVTGLMSIRPEGKITIRNIQNPQP